MEALRNVAYSPELPNIQTFLNPRQFLNLISHELTFPNNTNRSDEINRVLELVGLREYSETKVAKLSKGMVQRLSIAQALIGSPETLILDEPMIGLDPAGVAHFREVFKRLLSPKQRNGLYVLAYHERSRIAMHFCCNYSPRKNSLQRTSRGSSTKSAKLLDCPTRN